MAKKEVVKVKENIKRIHFIGIGGISMSGIAEILAGKGYIVSGSDVKDSHLLDRLRSKGIKVFVGHHEENVREAELVVITSAIPESNPELRYAREKGLRVLKRAEMLAELMKGLRGIAISGTHGKTSTTAMTAVLLLEGKKDPVIMLGGELDIINGNVYAGKGEYLLTEADESDGSLLYYDPEIIAVTNLELDHQDYYGSEDKLLQTFAEFFRKVPREGRIILNAEDGKLMNLVDSSDSRVITYGIEKGDIRAEDIKLYPFGSIYTLTIEGKKIDNINLKVPGRHNILNSLAAIGIALEAGMNYEEIKKGLEKYTGVKRRFEKKGLLGDILVIDDYAHHPTEIEATIRAARNTGYERIIVVFQPHRYTRTRDLMKEFVHSFKDIEHLIITEIYSAGEEVIPGIDGRRLSEEIARKKTFPVDFIAEKEDVADYLTRIVRSKDLVITMGAGDVYEVGNLFLEKMKKKLREMA